MGALPVSPLCCKGMDAPSPPPLPKLPVQQEGSTLPPPPVPALMCRNLQGLNMWDLPAPHPPLVLSSPATQGVLDSSNGYSSVPPRHVLLPHLEDSEEEPLPDYCLFGPNNLVPQRGPT